MKTLAGKILQIIIIIIVLFSCSNQLGIKINGLKIVYSSKKRVEDPYATTLGPPRGFAKIVISGKWRLSPEFQIHGENYRDFILSFKNIKTGKHYKTKLSQFLPSINTIPPLRNNTAVNNENKRNKYTIGGVFNVDVGLQLASLPITSAKYSMHAVYGPLTSNEIIIDIINKKNNFKETAQI